MHDTPQWLMAPALPVRTVPAAMRSWLQDVDSLTARLRALAPNFRVQLLDQGEARALGDEAALLGQPAARCMLVRQVLLHCHGEPCVFARTVAPRATLVGRYRRLLALGERPLGEVLFTDRHIRRGPMQVACLLPQHALYRQAVAVLAGQPSALWARRSLFYLAGRPLLVNEVFLPSALFSGRGYDRPVA